MTTQWTEPQAQPAEDQAGVPLIVTRPIEQSHSFADAIKERFGSRANPILSPLMVTELKKPQLPAGPYAAVIFTSVRAVVAVERLEHSLPKRAICVGKVTAERARKAGFDAVSADGASEELICYLVSQNSGGRLLHLRGEVARGDLAARLSALGIPTDDVVVYRQLEQPLSAAATAALSRKGPVIVPMFSPRSAKLFRAHLPPGLCADLYLVMISQAAATAGANIPARHVAIAAQPDGESMLDAVGKLLDLIAPA